MITSFYVHTTKVRATHLQYLPKTTLECVLLSGVANRTGAESTGNEFKIVCSN